MSRQPVVGGDANAWGSILNDYLSVSLATDGTVSRIGLTSAGVSRAVVPGGQTNFFSNQILLPAVTSTLQSVGFSLESTGGENGGGYIPFNIGVQSGASTGRLWGQNITVQQTNGTAIRQIIGLELDIANNQLASTFPNSDQVGYSAVSGGSKNAAIAYDVGGTGKWIDGYHVSQGGLTTDGYAFRYGGTTSQSAGVALTYLSQIQLGFLSNLGGPGEIHLLNNTNISGLNQPQTALVPMVSVSTGSDVLLAPAGDNIRWGTPQTGMGSSGVSATLGTIGGSGPPSAAQKAWEKRISSTGGTFWVPVWSSS